MQASLEPMKNRNKKDAGADGKREDQKRYKKDHNRAQGRERKRNSWS